MADPEIYLAPGGFHFGGGHTVIRTTLGSCVAIVLWHPERRIGGMCHFMLPSRRAQHGEVLNSLNAEKILDGRYADEAVTLFLREIERAGTRPNRYIGKLFGGGNMFPAYAASPDCRDVPCRNVKAARRLLQEIGVPLAAEHLGGRGHRTLVLELSSGDTYLRFWGDGAESREIPPPARGA